MINHKGQNGGYNYYSKYLKYKQKYIHTKNKIQFGGDNKIGIDFINKVLELLNENYIYPKKIKKLKNYIYDKIDDYKQENDEMNIVNMLYDDIQKILKDKHIKFFPFEERKKVINNDENQIKFLQTEWLESKIINKKIGYIKINGFPNFEKPNMKNVIIPIVIEAYNKIKKCDTIIYDLRRSPGGNPHSIRFLQSFLFESKTLLNKIYWRIKGTDTYEIDKFYTFTKSELQELTKIDDIPTLYNNKIIVLTSNKTFSAAEEFAYNLLNRKRATIIGEITAGGANPGGTIKINDQHAIFIPVGRSYNPISKTNWEGVGVKPDIQIDSSLSLEKIIKIINEI